MSYGMHDYLAEKAMQSQHAMRKLAFAGSEEDLSMPPSGRDGLLSLLTAPRDLIRASDKYNKLDAQNSIKPGTIRGKLNPNKTNEAPKKTNEAPKKQQSLRDIILAHVLSNKYAIGGALGAGGAGATIGALSSNENRFRNALLGGGIGAILGGVSGHIADRFIS